MSATSNAAAGASIASMSTTGTTTMGAGAGSGSTTSGGYGPGRSAIYHMYITVNLHTRCLLKLLSIRGRLFVLLSGRCVTAQYFMLSLYSWNNIHLFFRSSYDSAISFILSLNKLY